MKNIINFFKSKNNFEKDEWILKYQISSFLVISFFFSLYIFAFAIFRYIQGNYIVFVFQIIFASYLFYGFFKLKNDKTFYKSYTFISFILFIFYVIIIFLNVSENSLNILWIQSATVMIFFFLGKKHGIYMFFIIFIFILYLILIGYNYNISEYITLIGSFFTITFMMYKYDILKELEKHRLLNYTKDLETEISLSVKEIEKLNCNLELKLKDEINKNIQQEQMLIRQARLSNIGEMIDTIAHQWKQPLMQINSILMNMEENINNKKNSIDVINEKIEDISYITNHMGQTIEDFRNLFIINKQIKEFYLLHSFDIVNKILKNSLTNIDVYNNISDDLIVKSNENELIQVFLIILTNSLDAFKRENIKCKVIKISAFQTNTSINISISDNANGIKFEEINSIFNINITSKNKNNNNGLGLYIAKKIINENMNGYIDIKNIKNGAEFLIKLPK